MSQETPFRTVVDVPVWDVPMRVAEHSVFLGSCFAQQIGQRFVDYGLSSICNPLGVLYNPESIALQIHHALHVGEVELPIFKAENEWRCWCAGTLIGGADEAECSKVIEGALSLLSYSLQQADYLFLTLGTSVCYRLRSTGEVVANCHRAPQALFTEDALDVAQCVASLTRIIQEVRAVNSRVQIVFTVSPYRYAKYGFHRSQLAKASLLLAVDEVCRSYPDCVRYFPAYEIVMDELRDYRFYDEDMIHPSHVAVDYIWQRFVSATMDSQMQQYLVAYDSVRRGFMHRASHPDSPSHKAFLQKMEAQRLDIRKRFGLV